MDFDDFQSAAQPEGRNFDSPLAALSAADLNQLRAAAQPRRLLRGEILMRRGDPPDSLHFLATGRLGVIHDGEVVGEIAAGEPVGEIGFFAGMPRTFTVQAMRDSEVLTLTRATFDAASAAMPSLRDGVIRALALRLARLRPAPKPAAAPRAIVVAAAGEAALAPRFVAALRAALAPYGRARFLTRQDALRALGGRSLDHIDAGRLFSALEAEAERVVYIADDAFTDWTRQSIRQADMALIVAPADGAPALGQAERFAMTVHPKAMRRLVLLHEKRTPLAQGTAAWLAQRDVFMHHHVALEDGADVERLARFLVGHAVGFVAGGGGALGAAHLGLYKAFTEAGAAFDILGGTSIGAAMAAALAMGAHPDEIERRMHHIFVEGRAFRRFNVPFHALLDHKTLDAALRGAYGEARIEDLWRPYFALSADVTNRCPHVHREGLVWRAVRASSAIPGVLPPCFTSDGRMLVDGALFDNVPLAPMKALKRGPNLVVSLQTEAAVRYDVDYDAIPGPRDWLMKAVAPWRRWPPGPPNLVQVIVTSLLANRRQTLEPSFEDWLVVPDLPANVQWLQWRRQREIYQCAYLGAQQTIAARAAAGDPQLSAILGR